MAETSSYTDAELRERLTPEPGISERLGEIVFRQRVVSHRAVSWPPQALYVYAAR